MSRVYARPTLESISDPIHPLLPFPPFSVYSTSKDGAFVNENVNIDSLYATR